MHVGMNHAFLGGVIGLLPVAALYIAHKGRASLPMLIAAPLAMAAGMLWASFPDLPRLLGRPDLYFRWHADPRTDIFFWHYTIDQWENSGLVSADARGWTAGIVLLVFALLLMAWRELNQRETAANDARPRCHD